MPSTADLEALNRAAESLLHHNRLDEAIAAYRQLLHWQPARAAAWYNLGFLLHRVRAFEAALQAYGQALVHGIEAPEEVHLNRAVLLADELARPAEAKQALAAALALNPRYLPAWMNLATLQEQAGNRAAALTACEHVLAIDPHHALALSRLPHLQPVRSPDAPVIRRLVRALERPDLSEPERADLGFALGKALDDAQAYDAAFAAYTAANEASRRAGGGVRYDAGAHARYVDQLIASTGPAPPHAAAPPLATSPRLIFICGLFRSGSTLVERILASHPEVTAGGELDLIPALVRTQRAALAQPLVTIDPATLDRWRADYLQAVSSRFPGARHLTDKRPDNFLHLGLIKTLFPDARIVHTQRHPLDNGLSQYFSHLAHSMPYALDLAGIAHWQREHRRLMKHWHERFGTDIHTVDYDRLVHDPRAEIEPLLDACGLPWHDSVLRFHERAATVATPSAWQVREPLYQRASGRWRQYAKHLSELSQDSQ